MPINEVREREWAADAARCLAEFHDAVAAARSRNFAPGKALIERVRERGGDAMAEVARAELRKHAGIAPPASGE
ncbi:hypothetical protein [Pararobbsia silviterrae]|uniref:hypothetical protein n=1 Tax=Pararobbsia silviterrae TaxID=1792498 RepID=UPI0011C3EACA|nr:hypothetical protein [Pararobbsia silviterrae]